MKSDRRSMDYYWPAPWSHPRYRCLREIALGGQLAPRRYSRVFCALDREREQLVLVKQSRRSGLTREEHLFGQVLFRREAALLREVAHPRLVCLRETFWEGYSEHQVLEWIEGRTLEEHLIEHPLPPLQSICRWAMQICEGLDYLHRPPQRIVHRDIKPANIMICPDGSAILIDLSIARRLMGPPSLELLSVEQSHPVEQMPGDTYILGTLGYMAPEQVAGQSTVSSDLFSLGVVLHQMLTGEDPTRKPKAQHWAFAALSSRLPPRLVALVTSLIHCSPSARPGTAFEVQRTLAEVFVDLPENLSAPSLVFCA